MLHKNIYAKYTVCVFIQKSLLLFFRIFFLSSLCRDLKSKLVPKLLHQRRWRKRQLQHHPPPPPLPARGLENCWRDNRGTTKSGKKT